MNAANLHTHQHTANRFAVIPTPVRLDAAGAFTGKGVTIAFLDSGFYPHPDIVNRITIYHDVTGECPVLNDSSSESWQWHGTQTSVVAAGDGSLSDGTYRSLACNARLVLVKAGENGNIKEDHIAGGIEWVIQNRKRYDIRVLNISLGGDGDVPCSESVVDQAAEEAVKQGIVVVAAAGNSGHEGKHSIPPANSPSVITVGGYTDHNQLRNGLDLYQSNFGFTADGTLKPEIVAPAMWVAAPILPGTSNYTQAEALSRLAACFDYELQTLALALREELRLPEPLQNSDVSALRAYVEATLRDYKIVASHYQHVDGTSFAAPIVSSLVAQMIEANPQLTPPAIKHLLIATAERIPEMSVLRQGYGVINARRAVECALAETHLEPTVQNGTNGASVDRLSFSYHDDYARSVALAGDFNKWDAKSTQLSRDASGLWHIEIAAPPAGRYEYKFVVDATKWVEDPGNWSKAPDNFGGLNSVLVVD
jgi:serine protease AprX